MVQPESCGRASVWRLLVASSSRSGATPRGPPVHKFHRAEWAVKTWATPVRWVTLDTSLPPAEAVGETDVAEREEGEAADEASEGGEGDVAAHDKGARGEASKGRRATREEAGRGHNVAWMSRTTSLPPKSWADPRQMQLLSVET